MQQQGMFGPHPLDLQDQLDSQFLKENSSLDLGSLSGRAGMMIGKGVNQLLGREDPRVTQAKQVQEAVNEVRQSGVDMSDPAAYYRKMAGIFGAKGLTKQAEMAAAKALEFEDKKEQRAFGREKMANERQLFGMKVDQEKLNLEEAQTKLAIAKAKSQGKPWRAAGDEFVTKNFKELDPKSLTAFWEELDRTEGNISLAAAKAIKNEDPEKKTKAFEANGVQYVYDPAAAKANPKDAHPTLKDYVAAGKSSDRSTSVRVDNSMKFPLDQAALRNKFLDEVKPYRESLLNVGALASQLNLAGTNPAAAEAARTQFIKLFRIDGNTGKAEIERALNTGSLDDRVIQSIQGFLQGTLSADKIKNMREAAVAIHKKQRTAIGLVKKNYDNLDVPDKTRSFVTGTADLDQQSQDIDTALSAPSAYSPDTQAVIDKYTKGKK